MHALSITGETTEETDGSLLKQREKIYEQKIESLYTDKITAKLGKYRHKITNESYTQCWSYMIYLNTVFVISTGEDDHKEVYDELIALKAKWETILLSLKVPKGEIDSIKLNRPNQVNMCLLDGLMYWLRGNTQSNPKAPRVNWESILKAVKNDDESDFAKKIEEKFHSALIEKLPHEK